ncbi:hypothetical protein ABE28_005075 [Peribacillus muralis]|uniref:Uncharacterized protein n=1 Tax=Peribacillus muralis TaxID=264697 RepID=A0A1B3XKG8_9BACI|nr:hypothetical protein ABE28_005075 [Peribacillus muralis]
MVKIISESEPCGYDSYVIQEGAIGSASEFKAWIMVLLLTLSEQISNYPEADGARLQKCSV